MVMRSCIDKVLSTTAFSSSNITRALRTPVEFARADWMEEEQPLCVRKWLWKEYIRAGHSLYMQLELVYEAHWAKWIQVVYRPSRSNSRNPPRGTVKIQNRNSRRAGSQFRILAARIEFFAFLGSISQMKNTKNSSNIWGIDIVTRLTGLRDSTKNRFVHTL